MSELRPGEQIDRYRIESLLGRGGMGAVYRAYDTRLRRHVALKVLRTVAGEATTVPSPPSSETQSLSPTRAARMLREARAAAALKHPNVVTIFDVGDVEGAPFIAMELLDGASLRSIAGDARGAGCLAIPLETRLRWLTEVASALAAAHRSGFVHRDIKPDNIVVCADGSAKVLDFGVVKVDASEDLAPEDKPPASAPASFRTKEGLRVGTLRYMAPEQAAALPVDGRADQFAWGVTAYELLSGRHPSDVSPGFRAVEGWSSPATPLAEVAPELPSALVALVDRAVDRYPEARFASMDALLGALGVAPSRTDSGVLLASVPPPDKDTIGTATATVAMSRAEAAGGTSRRILGVGAVLALGSALAGMYFAGKAGSGESYATRSDGVSRAMLTRASVPPTAAPPPIAPAEPVDAGARDAMSAPDATRAVAAPHPVTPAPSARPPARSVMVTVFRQTGCPAGEVEGVLRSLSSATLRCFAGIDIERAGAATLTVTIEPSGRAHTSLRMDDGKVGRCIGTLMENLEFSPDRELLSVRSCQAVLQPRFD